ncbi:hypothetical protein ACFVR6_15700 [Microbacterium sp. NPDC058021]|uniref:hypothetical protein n=1 Tax=Microbacterium sp. NPDC058021 TaxID=3346306 RepID=UPI0036DF3AD1
MELLPQARAERARWGVGLLFFVNAIAFASIVPRYVELRETFSLDNGTFGLIIAAGPVGALAAVSSPAGCCGRSAPRRPPSPPRCCWG